MWDNNNPTAHENGVGTVHSTDPDLYGLQIPDDYNDADTDDGDTSPQADGRQQSAGQEQADRSVIDDLLGDDDGKEA